MLISVRNLQGFQEWADFQDSSITVAYGPNASGKSRLLAAFLLLGEQRDLFRLGFAGGAHGIRSFVEALRINEADSRIEFRLEFSVDAAASVFPSGPVRPQPVAYDFEMDLAYSSDPFDGGASGLLVEASIVLRRDSERVELFSVKSDANGVELGLGTEELLALPFVHRRIVGADEAVADFVAEADRSIEATTALARASRGSAATRARALLASLEAARREIALNRELERIVLPDTTGEGFKPRLLRSRNRSCRFETRERKYLRSLADLFVAESLAENGIRALRSRESGKEIRLSFYAAFYEILAAAGFIGPRQQPFFARFPARLPPRERAGLELGVEAATALGARTLARRAEEEYAALLRDAINLAACDGARRNGGMDGMALADNYGEFAIAFRESRGEARLVPEGGPLDPTVLDLEGRREAYRSFLEKYGVAEDFEFLAAGSEDRAVCLIQDGRREALGDRSEGIRRLVLVGASLLYLPWGGHILIEDPEAGLDTELQGAMAELLRLLVEKAGATVFVETRSAEFVKALGPYAKSEKEEGRAGGDGGFFSKGDPCETGGSFASGGAFATGDRVRRGLDFRFARVAASLDGLTRVIELKSTR